MLRQSRLIVWILALVLVLSGCSGTEGPPQTNDPEEFVVEMEARLFDLWVKRERASWVQSNFITKDTEKIAADLSKDVIAATVELAAQATRFDDTPMSDETASDCTPERLELSEVIGALSYALDLTGGQPRRRAPRATRWRGLPARDRVRRD